MARRNANGEGTICRRKDGRWEAAAYFLTTSGVRKRVRKLGRTRQEAHEKLLALKTQAARGIPVPDKDWRLGEYLDYWLENAVSVKRRALTHRRHEAIARMYLKPSLGKYTLAQLSVQIVQDFLDRQYADGQSAANIHQIRKVLSAALTYALRKELLFRNVARLVELPRYKPTEAQHWTVDETRRFLRAARPDPLHPLFVLLVLYGLRSGEVRGLRWCDVDFDQGVLRVRQQVQRIGGELRQVELKTDASERDEPILGAARYVLEAQRATQSAKQAAAGGDWQGSGDRNELVFTTRSGRPIEARNLGRSFYRICEQHGIRRITPHGVRHTNATTQKSLQVHDRDIQAILGHGDVRTTGIYEHVDLDSKRNALEKVEQRLFWRGPDSPRCRQLLPSGQQIVAQITSFISGGSSQTRTGDTRLFRATDVGISERATEVNQVMNAWRRQWLLGLVAVSAAVNIGPRPAAL